MKNGVLLAFLLLLLAVPGFAEQMTITETDTAIVVEYNGDSTGAPTATAQLPATADQGAGTQATGQGDEGTSERAAKKEQDGASRNQLAERRAARRGSRAPGAGQNEE